MTVPSTVSEISYATNGVTVNFPIPFVFDTSADIAARLTDSAGSVAPFTAFSVTGGSGSTGTLTTNSVLASGSTLTILDDPEQTQATDYVDNDPFPAPAHERALDKLTRLIKRLSKRVDRSLHTADGDPITDGTIGSVNNRKGKYLFFNAVTGAIEYAAAVVGQTLSQSIIGQYLFPQTTFESSALVTPTNYFIPAPIEYLKRYGGDPTGVADSTAAINAAISAAAQMPNGGIVRLGRGTFKVTSTLLVSANRVHIVGEGRSATRIVFAPTANDVLFEFHNGASPLVRCSLRGLSIYSSDATFTKTAIDLYDTEEFCLDDVEIGGGVAVSGVSYWSGANSIGLRTRGRQAAMVGNVQIAADRPVLVSVNPNSSIDIDHFNFRNLYLIANAHPCVEIETGVDLTNVTFDGYQAWVKGTHGLYWVDTTSAAQSAFLVLQNVRCEQGTSAGSYLVRIEHNTGLVGVKFVNCRGGGDALTRHGYYLRKVSNVLWDTTLYEGTGTVLDADATCRALKGINTFWQAASTATLVGQKLMLGSPSNPSGGLRPNFEYDTDANADETQVSDAALMGSVVSIAQDATATIGTNALKGLLFVVTDENTSAIYALKGSSNATAEVSDPDGFFTNAAGGATSYNIYATGGNYVIQNKRTGTHKVRYFLLGAHSVA